VPAEARARAGFTARAPCLALERCPGFRASIMDGFMPIAELEAPAVGALWGQLVGRIRPGPPSSAIELIG